MNLKHLIKFGMEESQEPVIKNPILRQALEPRTMDLAEGGEVIGKPGGLVEPGVEYYGKKVHSRRDIIDQKGIGEKILKEYEDGVSTVDLQKKYKVSKDTINRYIKKNKPSILRSASQGINQHGFDESVIDEIKIDAEEGLSRKEILEKHKGKIAKKKLKEVIDAENIEVQPYYKKDEVKGYKYSTEDLKKFATEEDIAKLEQAAKDLKAGKITKEKYGDIEFTFRRNARQRKLWKDLPHEVRRQKYLDIEASKTLEQKAADAERKREYMSKKMKEFGMDPSPKNSKDMLWRDISRSAKEGKGKGRIRFVEGTYIDPKKGTFDDFRNRRFIDTKTNVEFGYDDLEKYLDSGKAGKYKYNEVLQPYEIKWEINKSGLREEINKKFFGKDYKPRSLYNPRNAFHVHHVAGVVNDPFNVQFTFEDQNRKLMTNKTFNKEFKNLIDNNATYTQKKNFIKSATDRIGEDIAQQFGKKQYGTREGRLRGMFEKVGLDLNRPEVKKILKLDNFWCGTKKASGGRIGFASGSGCPDSVKKRNFLTLNNDVRTGRITGEAAEQIAKKTSDVVAKAGSRSALTKLLGPAGIGLDIIYEVGSVGTDIYGGKPWKEAVQDNWIAGAFMPGTSQEEFHKAFFKKHPEAKAYGSGLELEEAFFKKQKQIERLKASDTYRGKAEASQQLPQLEKDLEGIAAQYNALGNAMEPGSPEYEAYMAAKTEYLDARKAKAPSTKARLKMELEPIESDRFKSYEKSSPVKMDFSLPGNYTTFEPVVPSSKEVDEVYTKEGYDLSPEDIDYVQKMEKWNQLFNDPENKGMGIRGTQDWRGAGGGIAGIRRPNAIPPKSGPTPQGLPSMLNHVKKV